MKTKEPESWAFVWGLGILAIFAIAFSLVGCACTSCRADVQPSPQTQTQAPRPWHPSYSPPPRAPVPPVPRNDFETPATDGPDPTAPPEPPPVPPAPPAPPAPSTPPPPTPPSPAPGRSRTTSTAETEGAGNIINSNSGTIFLNSPGTGPSPGQAPQSVVMASPQAAYPVLPGPLPDAQAVGIGKRLLGGVYYAVTGLCPKKTTVAPASAAYLAVPQTTMAMVPVPAVQSVPVMVQQPAPLVLQAPAQAPVYLQQPAVMATPQFATSPDLTRKCWFFNKCHSK